MVFLSEQIGVGRGILHQQINWISSASARESDLIQTDIPSEKPVQEEEAIVSELRQKAEHMRTFFLSWKLHCADSRADAH